MKKIFYLLVTLVIAGQSPLFATNYYISASNTVSATNLKTIDDFNKKFPTSADCVFFKRGETFRGQIKKYAKFYGAYGTGARPKIMGSELLTGWTVASGTGNNTIWKMNYKSNVYQFFVDTTRQIIARWPNTNKGFAIASSGSGGSVTSTGIPAGVTGATIRGRINEWVWQNAKVTGQSGNTLNLSGLTGFTAGYGFCIDGVLPLLDADNEWVTVKATSGYDVYYNPAGAIDPNTLSIEGSVYFYAFGNGDDEPVSDGITDWNMSNLYLDNLDMRNQAWYGVWGIGAGATNNKIMNCDFRGQNQTAITFFGSNHVIQNCTFKNTLGNAIYLYSTSGAIIKGNTFKNIGEVPGMGRQGDYTMIAVVSDNGPGNYFGYNILDSIGSGGIYTSGTNAIIEKNIVRYSNLYTNDQGGLYTYGGSTSTSGTIFRNNYVYKTQGSPIASPNAYDAHGVYCDGGSTNVTVINNTIIGPGGAGVLLNGNTSGHTVKNNVIYGALHGSVTLAGWAAQSGYTISGNEFYARGVDETIIRYINTSSNYTVATFSNNYYVHPYVASASANIHIKSTSFTAGNNTTFAAFAASYDAGAKSSYYYGVTAATDKSQLFSNLSDVVKTYTLSCAYKDLNNADITTFTLQPYTSRILINVNNCNAVVTETTDAVANNMFSVYPNPTEGSINITSKNSTDVSATLYNYTGASLLKVEGSLEEVNSKINEVFANQKAGLYIIHLNDGTYTSDLKVIRK